MDNPFKIFLEPTSSPAGADVQVQLVTTSGRYTLGPPKRPNIVHDNGFLDSSKPELPTDKDRADYNRWLLKGQAAHALCRPVLKSVVPPCEDEDQKEATEAYLHYLGNTGAPRTVPYDKFLLTDESGKVIDKKITDDIRDHIEAIGRNRKKFQITSETIAVGNFDNPDTRPPNLNRQYPKSINWKRTIGAHFLWVSADVTVNAKNGKLVFSADVTIHMEDMYNFNPGGKDATTGIADEENGRFQVVGLAKQYLNTGTATRSLFWQK